MLLSLTPFLLILFQETEGHVTPWWDYPGLEVWKFVNLLLFAAGMIYFIKRPLSTALKTRKETIKAQLIEAQQERDAAQAELTQIKVRLERLDAEVAAIQEQSKAEAEAERQRIAQETQQEIKKLGEQAQRDIIGAGKVAKHDLRRFAAQQSVQMAEELIRRDIRNDDDARLIKLNVEQMGRG
ncbi:MAG TPA: ATP synthase F0 subunit B [Pyrinomonadaceae bacterium]|jgi:F0F1-type ATP synthase membrane subunit b/b'|nr:ATP synthase F0 subunit B [Pyrinomonadaceae bacterium]